MLNMRGFLVICLALIACAAAKATASKGRESLMSKTKQKDFLKEIFDSKVKLAELYARKDRNGEGYDHFGVVVTTWAGKRWLVHKGFGFSRLSSSVVTDARNVGNRWDLLFKIKVKNVTVRDYLKAAGVYFHPLNNNSFHAVERMMKLGRSRSPDKIGKAE